MQREELLYSVAVGIGHAMKATLMGIREDAEYAKMSQKLLKKNTLFPHLVIWRIKFTQSPSM